MDKLVDDLKLTKITVPIQYYTPSSARINTLKKDLAKEGKKEDEIERMVAEIKKIDHTKFNAIGINFMSRTLLSHSARKIYVVNFGRPISNETLSYVPKYYQSRIVWADQDKKIKNSIMKMLQPISEDIAPIWDNIRKQKGLESHSFEGHEHGLCILAEFLITMSVASKYETEADVNVLVVQNAINRIKKQVTSSESNALIARIDGILNCYNFNTEIPCVFPKSGVSPNELLKELMDDYQMIALSKSRYLLGMPGKFKIAMNGIKQKLSNLLEQPRNRKRLSVANKIGTLATKPVGISLPELEFDRETIFASPLIAINDLKPNCLKVNRNLLSTRPPEK